MPQAIDFRISTLGGQSNMVGKDNGSGFTTPPYMTFLRNVATSNWDIFTNNGFASLIPNFTRQLTGKFPGASIGWVRSAVSGKGIVNHWSDDTNVIYTDAITAINNAGGVDAVLVFGGENDIATGQTSAAFQTAFRLMISNTRRDTGISDLKFYMIKPWGLGFPAESAVISGALDDLDAAGDITILADGFDYQGDLLPDNQHYDKDGQDKIGNDAGNTFSNLITIEPRYTVPTYTVGTGGDYALLSNALNPAGVGDLTDNVDLDIISDITEPSNFNYTADLNGYTMRILSRGGYKIISGENADDLIDFNHEGPGTFILDGLYWQQTANRGSAAQYFFRLSSILVGFDFIIRNNIFDMNNKTGGCWRSSSALPVINAYGNMYANGTGGGVVLDASDGNANSIYENESFYNMGVSGYFMAGNAGRVRNGASYNSGGNDYDNVAGLSEFTNCVSSDATGSAAWLQNQVAATDFLGVDITDLGAFLIPTEKQILNGNGIRVVIDGHGNYANGPDILRNDVDIGANGLVRLSTQSVSKTSISSTIGII